MAALMEQHSSAGSWSGLSGSGERRFHNHHPSERSPDMEQGLLGVKHTPHGTRSSGPPPAAIREVPDSL